MKNKILLLSFSFFLVFGYGFAQKKGAPKSIISETATIKKYHNKEELDRMQKGELIELYVERVGSLVKILPYVGFATKPGVTMSSFGIPDEKDNRKALEDQFDATKDFLEVSDEFQKGYLPFSDTGNIISSILFYEEILKLLHEYSDYH